MIDQLNREDALHHANRTLEGAMRTAYPGVDGERETHLKIAVALSYYSRYAAATDRFGPDHAMTLAFLEIATDLAKPIGEETKRLVDIALA